MSDTQERIDAQLEKIREVCQNLIDDTREIWNYDDIEEKFIVTKDEIFKNLNDPLDELLGIWHEHEVEIQEQSQRREPR